MVDFKKLIESYLEREVKPKIIGRYYPSEIGSCMRKVWYSYKIPKETEADLRKIFWVGEMIHNLIVDVIKSEKNPSVELLAAEMPFQLNVDGFTISGRVDDIMLLKVEDKKMLVEVKSTSYIDYTNEPKEAHVIQLMLYMQAMNIKEGIVLYVEKNTLKTKAFTVAFEESLVNVSLNRFRTLHKHLVSGLLPDPEARIVKSLSWMCASCNYREECYKATPQDVLP